MYLENIVSLYYQQKFMLMKWLNSLCDPFHHFLTLLEESSISSSTSYSYEFPLGPTGMFSHTWVFP